MCRISQTIIITAKGREKIQVTHYVHLNHDKKKSSLPIYLVYQQRNTEVYSSLFYKKNKKGLNTIFIYGHHPRTNSIALISGIA